MRKSIVYLKQIEYNKQMSFNKSDEVARNRAWMKIEKYRDAPNFWNEFKVEFYSKGEQAYIGLLNARKEHISLVLKISQFEDYTILHEYGVLCVLNKKLYWLPNIPWTYGILRYKGYVDPSKHINFEQDENASYGPVRNGLLVEYISNIGSLTEFIENKPITIVLSMIKQILICIRIFRKIECTHYDLHTENILIKKCPTNMVLQYNIDGHTFTIDTYGYIPVIIDFGFAYVKDSSDILYAEMHSAYRGFMCDRFMPYTDYIRLFCSIAAILKDSTLRDKLLNIIKSDLVNPNNCWEDTNITYDFISRIPLERHLFLFEQLEWISALQTIPQNNNKIDEKCFAVFTDEWKHIELRLTHIPTICYIFRYLVELIKTGAQTNVIKIAFIDEFTRVVNSFVPSDIQYDKLISSIKDMAQYIHQVRTIYLDKREKELKNSYSKLPFDEQSCDDYIWNYIEDLSNGPDIVGENDIVFEINSPF